MDAALRELAERAHLVLLPEPQLEARGAQAEPEEWLEVGHALSVTAAPGRRTHSRYL